MSPQDKDTTERHTRILRELVKKPENRVCADCKHNDPRWASWNLGVFLCIRCSGIHRGMGTHISKVKSIDLDSWTPEQMEQFQKWGNQLANLYWEAHLKPGHIPPDHKMESFIRSKYESRRWAMDGPPPSDPSVLDGGSSVAAAAPAPLPTPISTPATSRPSQQAARQPSAPAVTPAVTSRQPQAHQLLSAQYARGQLTPPAAAPQVTPAPAAPAAPTPAPENDLFSLDFHAPPVNTTPAAVVPRKDPKQDILSLFSAPAAAASPWAQAPAAQPQPQVFPPFSNAAAAAPSAAAWNVGHNWSAPVPPVQPNVWGSAAPAPASAVQPSLLGSGSDVWGGSSGGGSLGGSVDLFGSSASPAANVQANKKDDVFGDIWGSFK